MMKIIFKKIRDVKTPERLSNSIFKLYVPIDYETRILLPFSDTLVPTGLAFPDLFIDYVFIPYILTKPSKQAFLDIEMELTKKESATVPLVVTPIEFINLEELYIHVINLGDDNIRIKGGSSLSYFVVSRIEGIELCDKDDDDNPFIF